jgi:flagellar P-ring protein precursor FlgI
MSHTSAGLEGPVVDRLFWRLTGLFALVATFFFASVAEAEPARLKDLARLRGVRDNFLNGVGLVIGLKGTGDTKKSLATNKAAAMMLTRLGIKTSVDEVAAGNLAAVMVTAELPAFARGGDRLDVKVSAIGDAKSLAGGTLVLTPLRAGDSEVYALAQGAVVVGQANGAGASVLTVARVPQAATVEREFAPTLGANGKLTYALTSPDFTTSSRIAEAINTALRGFFAEAKDVAAVEVTIPPAWRAKVVDFVAMLESLTVEADGKAVVVLNERTGTVVMGSRVVIQPVAIAHGDLSIKIDGKGGKGTAKGAGSGVASKNVVKLDKEGGAPATVGDLVETMNALGVRPADLVGILQAIHAAGALKAELKFL